jgi:ribosomal protein S18 acetylase RimI-like enzyme
MSTAESSIEIIEADLERPEHQQAVLEMTDAYCQDPMANSRPLTEEVRKGLIAGLRDHPAACRLILLGYAGDRPVGIATCFRGFSTFSARPLINVHDLAVIPEYRGRGIGRQLLDAVETRARQMGCCKLTLEVLEDNPASRLYEAMGYSRPNYENDAGRVLFLTKSI